MSPQLHKAHWIEGQSFYPAPFRFRKAAGGDQHVKVRIEIQVPPESMLHHQDKRPYSILVFHPLQDRLTANGGEVMQQVPVFFENVPENIRHGEDNAGIIYIRELGPLLPLPLKRRSITAARAGPHFTCEIDASYLRFRGIKEPSQRGSSACDHLPEAFADARANPVVIPDRSGVLKDLLHRFF